MTTTMVTSLFTSQKMMKTTRKIERNLFHRFHHRLHSIELQCRRYTKSILKNRIHFLLKMHPHPTFEGERARPIEVQLEISLPASFRFAIVRENQQPTNDDWTGDFRSAFTRK
jgi:alpha/beta superfamily hydrolase